GCPTGEARVTKGYRLPARWVIHTVGPIWSGGYGEEDELLAKCYINSFKAALELGVATVAFPSISTGAYRFPLKRAVNIALRETKFFLQHNQSIKKVMFVCFGGDVYKKYQELFKEIFE
ncbi:MAG TPA: RNase III inhibitor, partial [Desulfobacteraceae bacterium]|nr:RNase III inhibitor [Desulfobacteraceae bacterium]